MFVDRVEELAFLDQTLAFDRVHPASLVLLYGRRRVGKTHLLRHWAERTGLPSTYWAAEKEPAALQRRKLFARVLNSNPTDPVAAASFESWDGLWQAVAAVFQDMPQGRILILDELPYAAEGDPAMLSSLQHAWDQRFRDLRVAIVLCGSHVRAMETLMSRQSPLFGRLTGQWHLAPLPFSTLREFFPNWSAEERVAVYAIAGGVPAYLEWLKPRLSLVENIRSVVLAKGGMFVAEPMFLLYDELREPSSYLAVLKAIGSGNHSLDAISNACLMDKTNLASYLARLQELRLVERRVPATVKPALRSKSRQGRYHLCDPYFRFYFRFLAPYQDALAFDPEPALAAVRDGLRAFVGQTVFEELSREWVKAQGRQGKLPLKPSVVGSLWSRRTQVDVVAVDWDARCVLAGECKWGLDQVDRQVARDLIETKLPLLRAELPDAGEGWTVIPALFARSGVTAAARAEVQKHGGLLVDLGRMDREL